MQGAGVHSTITRPGPAAATVVGFVRFVFTFLADSGRCSVRFFGSSSRRDTGHPRRDTEHRWWRCSSAFNMNKNKKRVVLPSRPDPPTVDQILEDINRAAPNDPVFTVLEQTGQDPSRSSDSDMEVKFQQCRQYLELNEQLQEARGRLLRQREELRAAGEQLSADVENIKSQKL